MTCSGLFPTMDRIREGAKKRLTAVVSSSPHFQSEASKTADFVEELEAVLLERCPTPRRYRDKLLFLVANIPHVVDELQSFTPATLVTADTTALMGERQRKIEEREARKRARLVTIKAEDREDMLCADCGMPKRGRLNQNRFGLDDEILGNQFDNNYENLCQCNPADDIIARFGMTPPASSSDDEEEGEDDGGAMVQKDRPQPAAAPNGTS